MGNSFDIKPLTAILKNIFTFILLYFVFNYQNISEKWANLITKFQFIIIIIGIAFSFQYTYYLSPIYFKFEASYENKGLTPINIQSGIIDKSKYFNSDTFFRQNKQFVLAFLSMSCEHCKGAAKRLQKINEEDKSLPIFIVLNGDSMLADSFINEYKLNAISTTMLFGNDFINLAGVELPRLFLIRKDTIQNVISTRDLNTNRLQNWMKN